MISINVNAPSATIVIDRPAKCNALDRQTIAEIRQALDDLRQERKVRGIILTGKGTHFCSGIDLAELHTACQQPDAVETWHRDAHELAGLINDILHLPKPIIAAVDGRALGSGLALALACDLFVASQSAVLAAPAAKWGLVSGLVAPLAHFRGGAAFASRLLLGADEVAAAEAKQWGIVHHVTESSQIWVRSHGWVLEIAESAAEALQLSKRVLNEMVGEQILTALASGAASLATSLTTEAAREGLEAFSERRPPSFP